MKTRETEPYDPEKHGDGYSKMVPMHVEPEEGIECHMWGLPIGDNIYHRQDGRWMVREEGLDKSEAKQSFRFEEADGWTFRPTAPEPEKSYAPYLSTDGCMTIGHNTKPIGIGDFSDEECWLDPDYIRAAPDVAKAAIEFLQDTLTEQEEEE